MIKTELRLKVTPVIPILNANFTNYSNKWTGVTIATTTTAYPDVSLSNPSGTTTIPLIQGWTFSNTKYAMQSDGTGEALSQHLDTTLLDTGIIQTGFTYNVTFTISSQPDVILGGIRPVFMGYVGDEYTANGSHTHTFTLTGSTLPSMPSISFQPTGSFNGQIGGYLGPAVGGGGVVIQSTTSQTVQVDLYDDDELNLNFSYFDDVSNRTSTYSKTIRLPSTQNNATIFKSILSPDVFLNLTETDCVYMYKPIPCGLYYDSAQIIIGSFLLTKVIKNGNLIEYEGQVVSATRSFADALGDSLLTDNQPTIDPITGLEIIPDLDFTGYDHRFDLQNMFLTHSKTGSFLLEGASIRSSYSGSTGVYYPFMDLQGEETGNYLYLNNIKPSLYVKEIWDKIFKRVGYQYQSTFLNSDVFKSLIIPHLTKYQLDPESVFNLTFYVQRLARDIYSYTGNKNTGWFSSANSVGISSWKHETAKYDDDTAPIFYINNNSYSKTLYTMTIPTGKGGLYTFTANNIFSCWDIDAYDSMGNSVGAMYVSDPGTGGSITADAIGFRISLWVKRGNNWNEFDFLEGQLQIPYNSSTREILRGGAGWLADELGNLATTRLNKTFAPLSLGDGNQVQVRVSIKNDNIYWWKLGSPPYFPAISSRAWGSLEAGSTLMVEYSADGCYHNGNRVFTKYILPTDTKQIDFIKDISNMFCLNWCDHPTLKDTFIIEPWDKFFNTGTTTPYDTVYDWTSKMDLSREITYERIDFLIDRGVLLEYDNDSNDYNINDYNDTYRYTFGSRYIQNPVFQNQTFKEKISFVPALVHKFGSTNWLMSQIFNKQDRDSALEENKHYWASNFSTKVLFRKILDYTQPWIVTLQTLNVRIPSEGLTSGGTSNTFPDGIYSFGPSPALRNYHPYAGIYDDPYVPTLSLEFGSAKRYMDNHERPSIDLYLKYWQKKLNLFLDPNSKKITAYFRLNYVDIANIDFRKMVLLDNSYYYLYKINEWNPEGYCKVELLKASTFTGSDTLIPQPLLMTKGSAQNINTVPAQTKVINLEQKIVNYTPINVTASGYSALITTDNIYPRSANGIVMGKNNNLPSSNFFVIGKSNTQSTGEYGVLLGNNNINTSNNYFIKGHNNNISSDDASLLGAYSNNVYNSNVTILGSSGNTVYLPNVCIVGGQQNTINLNDPTGTTYMDGLTLINSSGNTVTDSSGFIMNSYNNTISGVSNSVLINSYGLDISDNTKTYINNRDVDTLTDINYVEANYFNKADDVKIASGKTFTADTYITYSGSTQMSGISDRFTAGGYTYTFQNGLLVDVRAI